MSGARAARVLVVGHSCLDSVAVAAGSPPADGKLEARRMWTGAGGPAANAAVALRRLGHAVVLLTHFADDDAGRIVGANLRAEGVELPLDPVVGGSTSLAQIRAVGDQRSVVWRRGDLPPVAADPARLVSLLDSVDLVYVDGHEVEAATRALELARERGRITVADPGSLRPGAEHWPALLDCCVATPRWLAARHPPAGSLGEALDALGGDAARDALVGVTLGRDGGFARRGGETLPWTARKTGIVDTTVAGDAFHAGLADGLLQGMSARDALDWSATLAAAVCRAPGRQGLPSDRAELQLWHGRWGFREAPDPALLGKALRPDPDQGTATR